MGKKYLDTKQNTLEAAVMKVWQVAAEELDLELDQVDVHLAETGVTPDEGYTAGSGSVPNSAMSVRYAAATARQKLLEMAEGIMEKDK